MFKAYREELSVYIVGLHGQIEVFYLSFPRFSGNSCIYSNLDKSCKERIDDALEKAKEVANRFNQDGRFDSPLSDLHKAFNRMY